MVQHLHGIYIAQNSEEANQALGAFIEQWQATPSPSSTRSSQPSVWRKLLSSIPISDCVEKVSGPSGGLLHPLDGDWPGHVLCFG